jgi:hypothetical protein
MDDDFEILWPYEDWLAQQEERGAAIPVTDSTMEPRLYTGDIVRVEERTAEDGDCVCLRIDGVYHFGYRVGDILEREDGTFLLLSGSEHETGVVTAVIHRDLTDPRFLRADVKSGRRGG